MNIQEQRRSTMEMTISPDATPLVHICATMWHETEEEMTKMLKSVFRLDVDQMKIREGRRPNYYDFEAHIFFDDAMEAHAEGDENHDVNTFVASLLTAVDAAATAVHKRAVTVPPPVRYTTPYGGRLQWTMPGGNTIKVHLKDKVKVRNKKRWSQVMSMYYHLVHGSSASEGATGRTAASIYLLHLDGDVDFKPHAMHLLLDMMVKDDKMGVVCGRTHPRGSGPLVWCQMFEYALSHWMQKATEDVFGCVLCCPGCFSLLRGSAVLQVLDRFTALPIRPKHYILEDQGEDRWLCTLLIQSGWRVKYCASSSCKTMAPEGLEELYKQRRRWTPSGFFHTVDLLVNCRKYTKGNDRMSIAYIIYQAILFGISLLAGSIILLVLSGALQVVSQGVIDMHYSVLINMVPIIVMGIACFVATTKIQLMIARVLTVLYALLQLLMLGFSFYLVYKEGLCSPPAIFLMAIVLSVMIAGILHPTESFYIICAIAYFFFAPSMYLLMTIYCLSNLHIVSWGTRENITQIARKDSRRTSVHELVHAMHSGIQEAKIQITRKLSRATSQDLSAEKQDGDSLNLQGGKFSIEGLSHDKNNPKWIQNEDLGNGPIEYLPEGESNFFQNLLVTDISPLDSDPAKQEDVTSELKRLRNKTVLVYYLLNVVFLVLMLVLQIYSEELSLPWPCEHAPSIAPLGLITFFMVFLGLTIQFIGMVLHRLISIKRECSRYCIKNKSQPVAAAAEAIEEETVDSVQPESIVGVCTNEQVSWISTECLIDYSNIQEPFTTSTGIDNYSTKL